MIDVSGIRCSDCLTEFKNGARFAVVKEDKSNSYTDEERLLGGHLSQVLVCQDCSGWYDDPIEAAPERETPKMLVCGFCAGATQRFATYDDLIAHQETEHFDIVEYEPEREEPR